MPANLENSAVATGLEKVSFHSNPKGNAKECSNYHTVVLMSHANKVMFKIFQARFQQIWELSDIQAGFRKGRGTKDQIANICWIIEKAREFQLSYFKSSKTMLLKCCTPYARKFGKLGRGHGTGKGQFSFQSQRKAMPKNAQTTTQWHSSHTLVK